MAKALSIVKHPVADYAAWRTVYEEVQPLRDKHPNNVTVLHWFPSAGEAEAFATDPGLKEAMQRAGVTGPPRIEIVVEA